MDALLDHLSHQPKHDVSNKVRQVEEGLAKVSWSLSDDDALALMHKHPSSCRLLFAQLRDVSRAMELPEVRALLQCNQSLGSAYALTVDGILSLHVPFP